MQALGDRRLAAFAGLAAVMLLAGHPGTRVLLQGSGALAEVAMVSLLVVRLRGAARQLAGTGGDDVRPVVLTADQLLVRTSLLWTVTVPRAAIASVTPIDGMAREPATLRAAFATAPNLLVSLTQPVRARGLLGLERTVSRIALHVDEPVRLTQALRE